ncbi:MAG: hypothetical protein ACRDGE_11625 [Candidatus Limnocylindria bacterium]
MTRYPLSPEDERSERAALFRLLTDAALLRGSAYRRLATARAMTVPSILVALSAPTGHAAWALARSRGDDAATPAMIALAAALLEVLIFLALGAAILVAARIATGTAPRGTELLRPLGFAQVPAFLYFLGLLPPLTQFMPLLPLALIWRIATTLQVARSVTQLPSAVAALAVLVGGGAGVFLGFAVASWIYA